MKLKVFLAGMAFVAASACHGTRALADDSATQTVIGRGAGITEDEALKDAFRDAVRQAVGTVVDAETLVKNDELISDKVLTYSDGFIKEHKVLSRKKDGGLVRTTIRATVERRNLIEKLQAVNVTVKAMDGQGLFAKAVTEMEAKASATQLLQKALADLPTMLTAEMVDKPTYASDQGEAVLQISIKPDRKAFDPFRERLQQVLGKIARRQDSVTIHSKMIHGDAAPILTNRIYFDGHQQRADIALPTWFHDDNTEVVGRGYGTIHMKTTTPIWPKAENEESWRILLCSFNDAGHTMTRWDIYVLDADPTESLCDLFGQTRLILSLSDSAGGTVTEEQLVLEEMTWPNHTMAFLRGTLANDLSWCKKGRRRTIGQEAEPHCLLVAPYCLYSNSRLLFHAPECKLERHIKLTLDELKRITNIRCKVVFRAASRGQNESRGKETKERTPDE